jgi:U2 small nuclear ribonucleoprotein A'
VVLSSISSFFISLGRALHSIAILFFVNLFPGRQNYRLYAINKIPTLKVLDFQKVKQTERERAQRLASSAAGAAMEADARMEARVAAATNGAISSGAHANNDYHGENGTNTFEPGEGKSAEESFATQFTMEEKAKIRDMVANAASADEIDRIENLVKRGIFPGSSQSARDENGGDDGISPPPPPPPSEGGNKRNDQEGYEESDNTKRQRTE